MVRLVYSNRTEALLAELAAGVRAQQMRDGPLVPVRIVVPSAAVEEYLRFGIASTCGVAANLEILLLTGLAAQVAIEGSNAHVAGARHFEAMALTLMLDDDFLQSAELAPVRAYLGAAPGRDGLDVRRVQLAARLGRLFEEYTYSRAEMLDAWTRGTTFAPPDAETEAWQRRFWSAMFADGGLGRVRQLAPLHETVSFGVSTGVRPGAVHLFGFAHFASTFHRLVAGLGSVTEVAVYTLSPCEGFWEDIDPRDPPPLHLWGRAGREHVRALDAIAAFNHEDRFVESDERTLLGRLQSDLRCREPAREVIDPLFAYERDESIRVLDHASIRRELEAIASEIWRLVECDATLRFDEIGIVLPDRYTDRYLMHLPSVFAEAFRLPHRASGVQSGGDSLVADAIELLLALPLGRFTRQELLGIAIHPTVVAAIDGADPTHWLAWCGALGVVHGADRSDHEGTYIERDLFNWDQALRRLALGAFMAGDASGERTPFALGADEYVPYEVAPSESRDAAALGVLLRSLVADARFARDATMRTKEWAAFFGSLVETYVAPARESDAEVLALCLRRLHGIGDMDLGEKSVSYRAAYELARAQLGGLQTARRQEGVRVSGIAAMRTVPLRVAFACGMGEGCFPSAESEDPLDLRLVERQAGDVTPRDRDKYAFLELLLCARERLYLSYVSRDPLTGDELAPSSVVQELLHTLRRGYVRDLSGLHRRHPLRRWDPIYFPDIFGGEAAALGTMRMPEARVEARALALRRSVDAHGGSVTLDEVVARATTEPAFDRLAGLLGLSTIPEAPPVDLSRQVVVPLYAIVKFLEFPLQGWARFRVGLDEPEDDDVLACESEPFETAVRDETLLLRAVLFDALARGQPLAEAYDGVVHDRELRGTGPSGLFARGERGDHLRTLATWYAQMEQAEVTARPIETFRFGRAGEQARLDRAHPALVLDVPVVDSRGVERALRVEISGRTLPLCNDAHVSLTTLRRSVRARDDVWTQADAERSALRAFVDHAVLSASGITDHRPHESLLVLASPDGAATERSEFQPFARDEAISWLRRIVAELLGGPHAYFFPCEAILARQRDERESSVSSWLEKARDKLRDADEALPLRSAYGPVPRVHRYPNPDEATARTMIANRFGPFFAKSARGVRSQ